MGSLDITMPWSVPERSPEEAKLLFQRLEKKFPSRTLGEEKWYIMTIAALTGGGQPETVPLLYDHLIAKPEYSTSAQRQALVRRIREALVKCVSIIGVCKPLEAIFSLIPHERPEDRDLSCSREGWQCDEANDRRGFEWQNALYKANQGAIDDQLSNHKDFDWISKKITYGLYLSDQRTLDAVDTEMVVLSGIMIQNLPKETAWHLRGTRRIGVSFDDVELVQQCIELVAEFCDLKLNRVPRVADIEHEV